MKSQPPHYYGSQHPGWNSLLHEFVEENCACGCRNKIRFCLAKPKKFISGHNSKSNHSRYKHERHILKDISCGCGCGTIIKTSDINPIRFVHGHNTRIRTKEQKQEQIKLAHKVRKEYYKNNPKLSSVHSLIKTSSRYLKWRKDIFIRDNYKCVECNGGGELHAHHKIMFSTIYKYNCCKSNNPDELLSLCMNDPIMFDINNGETLCISCHSNKPGHSRLKHIIKKRATISAIIAYHP